MIAREKAQGGFNSDLRGNAGGRAPNQAPSGDFGIDSESAPATSSLLGPAPLLRGMPAPVQRLPPPAAIPAPLPLRQGQQPIMAGGRGMGQVQDIEDDPYSDNVAPARGEAGLEAAMRSASIRGGVCLTECAHLSDHKARVLQTAV